MILYDARIEGVTPRTGVAIHAVPAAALAAEAGSIKAANTVMLGAISFFGVTGLDRGFLLAAVEDNFAGRPKLIELNRTVFELAEKWAAAQK